LEAFSQYFATGIATGIIYALVALGFVVIFKSSGVLNIAQGALLMFGSHLAYMFAEQAGLPFWIAALLAIGASFLMGRFIERLMIRPMIGQPVFSVIMITITLMVILEGLAQVIWGPLVLPYKEIAGVGTVHLGPAVLRLPYIYGFFACAVVFAVFFLFYQRTGLGLAMRATSDDETAAHSMGISGKRIYGMAWGIACLVAAIGGIFMGWIMGVGQLLSPIGLMVFPIVILGGLESIGGALIGGVIIGLVQSFAGGYLDPLLGTGTKELAPYILMLIVLMIRPFGLFGLERIERI
jgi:branched-chain amino acid transport system permease protein